MIKKLRNKVHEFVYRPYFKLSRLERSLRVMGLSLKFFFNGEYTRQATALTYYTIFAIVPLVALFFGIAKGFAFEERLKTMLSDRFADHQETLSWIYKFADTTLHEASGGIIAGVGVFMLFATVIMLASSIEDTFNMIWDLQKRRALINKVSNYLALLVITPIMLIVASAVPVVEQLVVKYMSTTFITRTGLPLFQLGMDFLPIIIACLLFSTIYFVVPNTKVKISSALVAGVIAGILFYILQNSLLVLQIMLSKYNTIYGSFSILPLFLLWLQWSWLIVLFGAKIAYVHQSARTGKFDQDAGQFNNRYRKIYSLAITQKICHNFISGAGATSEWDIIHDFELNIYRCNALIEELLNCNVIAQQSVDKGGSRYFLPAIPPQKLTPLKVFELLDGSLDGENIENTELKELIKRCNKLNLAVKHNKANRPLGTIVP